MSDRIDISATIKVNDQASAAINQMRGALQGVQQVASKVGTQLQKLGTTRNLGNAMKGLGSSVARLGSMVMSVVRPVAALVGITGGIGMAEAIAGMEHYVTSVKELSRMAPVIGTTVERLSELQYAASKVGIDAEQMNGALVRANTNIAKAAVGKGTDLTKLFQQLSISLRDTNGNMRSSADIFEQFADAIARQTDPVLKLRMATELFGRAAGPEMLKLLDQGSAGIQQFIAQARELGLTVNEEQAAKALEFAKAQGEVRNIWASLSRQLSQNLMPILLDLVKIFAELFKENQAAIVEALTEAFRVLGDYLKSINWRATIEDIKSWGSTIQWVVELMGGWKVAFGLLLAAMGAPFIAALVSVATNIAWVGASLVGLAVANPVIAAIVVAIGALIYAGYQIYKNWEPIKQFFIGLWDGVKAAFAAFVDWLGPWGDLFVPILIYKNWDAIVTWFSGLWERVKGPFNAIVDWLGPWGNLFLPLAIYKNWEGIKEFFSRLWQGDVQGAFDGAVAWLGPWGNLFLPVAIYNNWSGIKEFFSRLWEGDVQGAFDGALRWFTGFVTQFIPQPVLDAWSTVQKFFTDLLDGVAAAFQRAWKIIEPIVTALRDAIGWIANNMPSLSGIGEKLGRVGSAVWNAPGNALDLGRERIGSLLGGGGQSVVQQQAAAQPAARVDGEVGVDIHMTGAPPGTTIETHERGQVRATGDVGHSMAPA